MTPPPGSSRGDRSSGNPPSDPRRRAATPSGRSAAPRRPEPRTTEPRTTEPRRTEPRTTEPRSTEPRTDRARATQRSTGGTSDRVPRADERRTPRRAAAPTTPLERSRLPRDRGAGRPHADRASTPERTARTPRPAAAPESTGRRRPTERGARPDGQRVVSRPVRARAKTRSVRGRRVNKRAARINQKVRGRVALTLMLSLLAAAMVKLVFVQVVNADSYAAIGAEQRQRTIELPAQRGRITDATGTPFAFSVEGRRLAIRPTVFVDDIQRGQVADKIMAGLKGTQADGTITRDQLLVKMKSGKTYVYVADKLTPAQADVIMASVYDILTDEDKRLKLTVKQQDKVVNAVSTESQSIREYPSQSIGDAIVGTLGWDGHGLSGVENRFDSLLAGTAGSRTFDIQPSGTPIPGTVTSETPATDGSSIQLSINASGQYMIQQMVCQTVTETGAREGSAFVTDARTNKVYAMASCKAGKTPTESGNGAITDQIEPGSVNKVVTFAAALEAGKITENTVLPVDYDITFDGGTTVRDAWVHPLLDMKVQGILAKSSNVGTLKIAQLIGPQAFYDMERKLGIGSKTGVELNDEASGSLRPYDPDPAKSEWTAGTFANMPIGQGLSMTMVQLATMYQAIANDGVLVKPSIIQSTTSPDGKVEQSSRGAGVRVMSVKTARTLQKWLTATMQDGEGAENHGTAPFAAINGYQVAGKTGTAQQYVNGAYSDQDFTTTFAGFLPADKPQYVITISLDRPTKGDREGGTNAAPLFHDIGSYLMDAMDVPPSTTKAPDYTPFFTVPAGENG
ncbi:MAG: penicillin-binding transpeptidase domain-containing protein [Nakamurella sp.]